MSVSEHLRTYPSPNPTTVSYNKLGLTLGLGRVGAQLFRYWQWSIIYVFWTPCIVGNIWILDFHDDLSAGGFSSSVYFIPCAQVLVYLLIFCVRVIEHWVISFCTIK